MDNNTWDVSERNVQLKNTKTNVMGILKNINIVDNQDGYFPKLAITIELENGDILENEPIGYWERQF